MSNSLSDRSRLILAAVVANYIATAEPVGSRTISNQDIVKASPATVRSVMAELEERGLLEQPHISAGRVPTEEGLRLYVDSMLPVGDLDLQAKHIIQRAVDAQALADPSDLLKNAGRALSDISKLAAVVAAPKPEQEIFRHIEFVKLGSGVTMVVLVARSGSVQNRLIRHDEDHSTEDLDKYTRYLNDLLGDLTLSEVRMRVARELADEKNRFDEVLGRALALGQMVFSEQAAGDVFVEGQTNLMDEPEFADLSRLRSIFRAFEEKSNLLRLLERSMQAEGVRIFIGADSLLAGIEGVTAVTSAYGPEGAPVGALAVIGPTRMDYSKVIATVDFTARLVSKILDSRGN